MVDRIESEDYSYSYDDNIKSNMFKPEDLFTCLKVVNLFRQKYPNDDTVSDFENIVRDEIAQMVGATCDEVIGY